MSSGQVSFQRIAFGYYQTKGAYFKVVRPDGKAVSVGYNNRGQLGNNSYDSTLTPKPILKKKLTLKKTEKLKTLIQCLI